MSHRIRSTVVLTAALGVLGSGVALAPSALAQGPGTRASGPCSVRGTWQLDAKPDDGALQVEAEVDVNQVGQRWQWKLYTDGSLARSGSATTAAPSGSFTVNRVLPDKPGLHKVTFRASNAATGNSCVGTVTA